MGNRPPSGRLIPLVMAVLWTGSTVSAAAQDLVRLHGLEVTPEEAAAYAEPPPGAPAPGWGSTATSTYSVGPCDAGSRDTTHTYSATGCGLLRPLSPGPTSTRVGFPLHLPTGALITSVTMHYFDNGTATPSVGLYQVSATGATNLVEGLSPGAFSGGDTSVAFNVDPQHQVDNAGGSYVILAILDTLADTTYTGIHGFSVKYRLQVSPAPGVATFTDVPTDHPFFRFVEALAQAGITGGCGGGLYCPNQPVTRGQMAVFLSVALGLHFPN